MKKEKMMVSAVLLLLLVRLLSFAVVLNIILCSRQINELLTRKFVYEGQVLNIIISFSDCNLNKINYFGGNRFFFLFASCRLFLHLGRVFLLFFSRRKQTSQTIQTSSRNKMYRSVWSHSLSSAYVSFYLSIFKVWCDSDFVYIFLSMFFFSGQNFFLLFSLIFDWFWFVDFFFCFLKEIHLYFTLPPKIMKCIC